MKRTRSMIYTESAKAEELYLFAINDGVLYNSMISYVIRNLEKKAKKGVYDTEKAIDAWYCVAEEASRRYSRNYGGKFTVTERFTCAVDLETNYREQILESVPEENAIVDMMEGVVSTLAKQPEMVTV